MEEVKRFPYEAWRLTETEFDPSLIQRNASLFFLGNGYLGIRGGFEEGGSGPAGYGKGCFINGFYESSPQVYGESAFGFPDKKQAMLNLPDPTSVRIYLDDEMFDPAEGSLLEYSRSLNLKEGLLVRKVFWESPAGRRIRIKFTRCVSMDRSHLSVIRCEISEVSGVKRLVISSGCGINAVSHKADKSDPRTGAGFEHSPLECIEKIIQKDRLLVRQKTVNSGLEFGEVVSNSHCSALQSLEPYSDDDGVVFSYEADPDRLNENIRLDKFISYYTSIETDPEKLLASALNEVTKGEGIGADAVIDDHKARVAGFWAVSDVKLETTEKNYAQQQGIRFNVFSIYQSAGRDGFRNIAAKGLSGEGYEGHYFWDTEIYVIPFFSYTFPVIAEKLLEYRYRILEKARRRAEVMSEKGALFPWRTINGEEASAYFPAGTAQYHINADIVYGIKKYYQATDDTDFLFGFGSEILVETARLWMTLGFFDERTGKFKINGVTGPDEYTAIVNNNYFTNIMAADSLVFSAETVEEMSKLAPELYDRLVNDLNLDVKESGEWRRAAELMYLPFDEDLCVHAQDDSFLSKEKWDFSDKKLNKHPLLLHLHPLVIYRYQILKQPDVVLANFLQNRSFSRIEKMRDYDYYNPLTTGDSSLAPCVQSIMAAELGKIEEAKDYFMKTARMDLDDINSNVSDGVHVAAMGGTWLSLIYGFAGLREEDGMLCFSPRLPAKWTRLEFNLLYRGCKLNIKISSDKTEYSLEAGNQGAVYRACDLKIKHMGGICTVRTGGTLSMNMKPELKAVIFDLDGVITDTSELHYRAWKMLADKNNYTFSREINEKLRGISRIASLEIILEASGAEVSEEEKNALASQKNEYYKALLKTITPENILPGISEFLAALKDNKIKTALASASRNAFTVIDRLGIASEFDVIMDAAKVKRGKPDPEIFVSAAEKLGVPVEFCAGVEDAAAGIESIKAAGIFSVGIGPAAAEADWPLPSTAELTYNKIFERFSQGQQNEGA